MSVSKKERTAPEETAQGVSLTTDVVCATRDSIRSHAEEVKHLKDRIVIGGNLFIRRLAQVQRGDNSDVTEIIADVWDELALTCSKDQLDSLGNLINDFLRTGDKAIAKGDDLPAADPRMDLFVHIYEKDVSIALVFEEDQGFDFPTIELTDQAGSKFSLQIDSKQAKRIHALLDKFITAQNMRDEIMSISPDHC